MMEVAFSQKINNESCI